jgi:hypothetical protein
MSFLSWACHNESETKGVSDMFNFQMALLPWNGEHIGLLELQKRLSDLRLQHLGEIAPEIGVRELLLLALEREWIVEEPTGQLHIQVPDAMAA